jgi:hypothetical protein
MGKKVYIVSLPDAGGRLVSFNVLASTVANAVAIVQTTLNVNHDPVHVNVLLTGVGTEVIDIANPTGGPLVFIISIKDSGFNLVGRNVFSDTMNDAISAVQADVGVSGDPSQMSNLLNGRGTGQIDLVTT